jgi:GT2 family glycosyltransferase
VGVQAPRWKRDRGGVVHGHRSSSRRGVLTPSRAKRGASSVGVSVVTVTYNCRDEIERTLAALCPQLRPDDELIVVDNGSTDGTVAAVLAAAPTAVVIESGANIGFAAACNAGAAAAGGELLVLLNPDAAPAPGWREGIGLPCADGRGWGAWMALVTAQDGAVINTRGGVVHFTGIAWAGGAGEPRAEVQPGPVGFASGACFAIPLARWRELGGFPPDFFLYQEDVDLSLRLRLAGEVVGIEPAAVVDHEYEFEKGPQKWLRLERNRWAVIIRDFPGLLLVLIAPALLATELALVPVSIAGGWLRQKLAAWAGTIGDLPRLLRERRSIQAQRTISAGEFARGLVAELDSPFLGAVGRSTPIRAGLRAYWALVLTLLRAR